MPANDQYWRDLPTMHKVFAGSAFALFAATLLMMARDEKREWRDYQRQAEKLKVAKIAGQLEGVDTAELRSQVDAIEKKITEIFSGETEQKAREAEAQVKLLKGDLDRLATESKFKNAERDVARANFDIAVRDAIPDAEFAKVRAAYNSEQLQAEAKVKIVEGARAKFEAAKAELVGITAARDAEKAELDKLTAARKALVEQIELLQPSTKWIAAKRSFKEWPIINGFNPHLKIQYDWPKGLKQQLGMANVDRVDRCRSCHVNINDFGAGNVAAYPAGDGHGGTYHQPFSAHPNPDLFLTATSPHPIDKFGCTICHEGDGSGTSFQNAEHAPTNPAQAGEWGEKHHWHSNHFWELPMFPKHLAEATCIRCHHDVTSLAASDKFGNSAPKVVEGHSLISKYGCFGCHEINGYDAAKPIGPDLRLEPNTPEQAAKIAADPNAVAGSMRKVGPSLRHLAQKSTPEFVAYWTENPSRFRPTTRMPKFFGNSNQQDHLAEMLQPVELQAVAAYLDAKSEAMDLLAPKDGYQPDPARGKNLFSRRGCMACHSYDDEELKGVQADFGPDLTKIHEKIKPGVDGFKWMYTWLKEPNRYHTRTKMPNLYLNPEGEGDKYIDPAADIAAFLLAKGPTEFPKFQTAVSVLGVVCDDNFTDEEAQALGVEHTGVRITEVLPGSAATRLITTDDASKMPWDADGVHPQELLDKFEELDSDKDGKLRISELAQRYAKVVKAANADQDDSVTTAELTTLIGGLPQYFALQADDIVTKVGSNSVRSVESLNADIGKLPSGDPVTLTYVRGGRTLTAQVKVSTPLDDLVRLYLKKALGSSEKVNAAMLTKQFPVDSKAFKDKDGKVEPLSNFVKGDEIELAHSQKDGKFSPEEWERQKLIYIGRKTVSRYGCYGCHDIPGFEDAGPIGMALQDWGRKDTSKLAPEHIAEYLHHHGEVDGSSTLARVEGAIDRQKNDGNANPFDLSAAFFVDSLLHHGRPGFVWQKLRDPRSYDYKKIETKGWDERLRMPKFPFSEQQIESVATFVVGLVADPPAPAYQFKPSGAKAARLEGERLLSKYNCGGCHILEMPEFKFAASLNDLTPPGLGTKNFASALPLLSKLMPPTVLDPEKLSKTKSGDLLLSMHGLVKAEPDPEELPEDQILVVNNWDHLQIGDKTYFPGDSITIPATKVVSRSMGRGGDLAHWLAPQLKAKETAGDNDRAWQASPPPLVREGVKVQTPWLYQFLKEPHQIRHTTVLRMPKFNMDDKEAMALANYFAAVDNAEFPYQENTRQNPDYLAAAEAAHAQAFAGAPHDRLTAGWKLVTTGQCTKCHQVGGLQYVSLDPAKDIRGPNLDQVEKRLRSDWVQLWVTNPKWVTPYTSMPQVYAADASIMPEYIGGQPAGQIDATVDALLNYLKLLERHGKASPPPATPAPAPAQ